VRRPACWLVLVELLLQTRTTTRHGARSPRPGLINPPTGMRCRSSCHGICTRTKRACRRREPRTACLEPIAATARPIQHPALPPPSPHDTLACTVLSMHCGLSYRARSIRVRGRLAFPSGVPLSAPPLGLTLTPHGLFPPTPMHDADGRPRRRRRAPSQAKGAARWRLGVSRLWEHQLRLPWRMQPLQDSAPLR